MVYESRSVPHGGHTTGGHAVLADPFTRSQVETGNDSILEAKGQTVVNDGNVVAPQLFQDAV